MLVAANSSSLHSDVTQGGKELQVSSLGRGYRVSQGKG